MLNKVSILISKTIDEFNTKHPIVLKKVDVSLNMVNSIFSDNKKTFVISTVRSISLETANKINQ